MSFRGFIVPLAGTWVEMLIQGDLEAITMSFPLRETWIEIEYFGYGVEGRTQSFPLQQRRLKSLDITPKYAYNNCSPAGTWIEIKLIGGDLSTALVVPPAGTWVDIVIWHL